MHPRLQGPSLFALSVLLAALTACEPAPPPSAEAPAGTVEAAALPTRVTTFDEVAFVQTPACSNDYTSGKSMSSVRVCA